MDGDKGHFTFGVDMSPKWFLDKVASKDVEYTERGRRVVGCRFYDVYGKEHDVAIGQEIYKAQLYTDC